jgi:hypothetical protein
MQFVFLLQTFPQRCQAGNLKRDRDRLDDELQLIIEEKRTSAIKGFSALSQEGEIVEASA